MKKKIVTIVIILVFISLGLISYYFANTPPTKSEIIETNINELKSEEEIEFSKITPFVWDKAFIIEDPFTDTKNINTLVGVECNLQRLESDINRRIVFIKDGKFIYDFIYDIRKFKFNSFGTLELSNSSKILKEFSSSKQIVLNIKP
ncbi:hypothetical protein NV379_21730 [Paenibacillus sp. N1-5-1-14]|uniref:hypothetical protein n=1 Tax=Paenibacillus radicibacter TaxID=2972488 RepID=UPI002158F52E|nr:hypothetical protein [Paenibacillus radicibacter]MCR8645281.1 hypothetical protein [Paenibacillus radicibacter]